MNNLLYRILPLTLSMVLSQLLYMKLDKLHGLTSSISSKLPIKKKFQPCFFVSLSLVFILLLGVLGIYVIYIPDMIYSIISGILTGISVSMANAKPAIHSK